MPQQLRVSRSMELLGPTGESEKILTRPDQWFTEESVVKLYDIGTKLVVEDMVFRYAHIETNRASAWRGRGMHNLGKQNSAHNANGYIPIGAATAASAGATTLVLTLGTYDSGTASHSATANEFQNGEVYLESSPWTGLVRGRIRNNDASSTTTNFYLKEGIVAAISATPNGKLHWNQYAYVGTAITDSHASKKCSCVGCLNVNATADYYVWLQTWGPYMGQYGSTTQPGEGNDLRAVYFDRYGAFVTGTSVTHQYAGHSLPCTMDNDADGFQGWSPLVMLQIAP